MWHRQTKDLFLFLEYFPFLTSSKNTSMVTFQRHKYRGRDTKVQFILRRSGKVKNSSWKPQMAAMKNETSKLITKDSRSKLCDRQAAQNQEEP